MAIPYKPGDPLTVQEIRELDILTIEHVGIPGIVLMENAARSAAESIHAALLDPEQAKVVVLCGPGNNGGDGFVIARHLKNAGVNVAVIMATPREKPRGDAGINLGIFERMEGTILHATDPEQMPKVRLQIAAADIIVDALLGTGSQGAPRDLIADLIQYANDAAQARRVAIDIPSGLNADTGEVAEPCFRANATVTFIAPKVGFAAESARAVLGRVIVADIGVPRRLIPGRRENR